MGDVLRVSHLVLLLQHAGRLQLLLHVRELRLGRPVERLRQQLEQPRSVLVQLIIAFQHESSFTLKESQRENESISLIFVAVECEH